jgi:outer membrane biosynthesis protein TonB
MRGMTQDFSTRALPKGLLWVTVTVLMLLGALLIPGGAGAETVKEQGSEALPLEKVAEAVPPVEPVVEQVKEAPPVEKVAEVVPPVEPVEEAPPVEQVKEAPPVEKVAEVVAPTEPVVEQAKETVSPVEPVKEAVPPVVEPVKELLTTVEPSKEQLASGPTSPPDSGQAAVALPSASTPVTEAPAVMVPSPMTPPTSSGLGETPTASTAPASLSDLSTHLTAAQRAGELSCQLSGMAGPATDNCTASWLSNQPLLASSPGDLVIAAPTRASAPAGDGSGGSGGSFGGTRSFMPPPGPAPSGAVGGSAAGGSGVGLSGFFTLAGQLRLAGPRAMRRLRLSSQPWLTAFFVLIPERPG